MSAKPSSPSPAPWSSQSVPPSPPSQYADAARSPEALIALLFLIAGVVLFAPILGSFFLSDDFTLLAAIRSGGPLGIWWRGANFFRPLVSLSLYLDYRLYGLLPLGFHLTNVLLHSGCAFLVYRIAAALALDRLTALLAGVAFLTLPAHSEPVSWISGRTDVLAALLGLAALDVWLRRRGRTSRLILALALSFFALCAKESVITLFAIIFFADCLLARPMPMSQQRSHRALGAVAFLAAGGVYLMARRAVLGKWLGGYGAAVHFKQDLMQVAANLVLFPLRALLAPVPAALLPRSTPTTGVQQAVMQALRQHLPAWVLLLLLLGVAAAGLAVAWQLGRRAKARFARSQLLTLGFLLIAAYLALLPILSLTVPMLSTDGERFLYFPSAFLVIAAVALLRLGLRGAWVQRTALALLLVFYVVMLGYSNQNWRQAGKLTAQIVAQLRQEPAEPPLLLANLPDSIGGAFVFRNGLEAALQLFDETPRAVFALTRHTLLGPDDEVAVTVTADTLAVQLLDPRDYFFTITPPPPGSPFGEYTVQTQERSRCALRRRQSESPPALRYYSRGQLHALDRAGRPLSD